MKVTFTDGRVFEVGDADSITNVEAMAIERVTDMDMSTFSKKLEAGSALAITAWVWVMARRAEPTIRFDDVEFDLSTLETDEPEPDPTEGGEPA